MTILEEIKENIDTIEKDYSKNVLIIEYYKSFYYLLGIFYNDSINLIKITKDESLIKILSVYSDFFYKISTKVLKIIENVDNIPYLNKEIVTLLDRFWYNLETFFNQIKDRNIKDEESKLQNDINELLIEGNGFYQNSLLIYKKLLEEQIVKNPSYRPAVIDTQHRIAKRSYIHQSYPVIDYSIPANITEIVDIQFGLDLYTLVEKIMVNPINILISNPTDDIDICIVGGKVIDNILEDQFEYYINSKFESIKNDINYKINNFLKDNFLVNFKSLDFDIHMIIKNIIDDEHLTELLTLIKNSFQDVFNKLNEDIIHVIPQMNTLLKRYNMELHDNPIGYNILKNEGINILSRIFLKFKKIVRYDVIDGVTKPIYEKSNDRRYSIYCIYILDLVHDISEPLRKKRHNENITLFIDTVDKFLDTSVKYVNYGYLQIIGHRPFVSIKTVSLYDILNTAFILIDKPSYKKPVKLRRKLIILLEFLRNNFLSYEYYNGLIESKDDLTKYNEDIKLLLKNNLDIINNISKDFIFKIDCNINPYGLTNFFKIYENPNLINITFNINENYKVYTEDDFKHCLDIINIKIMNHNLQSLKRYRKLNKPSINVITSSMRENHTNKLKEIDNHGPIKMYTGNDYNLTSNIKKSIYTNQNKLDEIFNSNDVFADLDGKSVRYVANKLISNYLEVSRNTLKASADFTVFAGRNLLNVGYIKNFEHLYLKNGQIIISDQITSTSLSYNTAISFKKGVCCLYEINIPKKSTYILLNNYSQHPGEEEILLPLGAMFKIKNVSFKTTSNFGGTWSKYVHIYMDYLDIPSSIYDIDSFIDICRDIQNIEIDKMQKVDNKTRIVMFNTGEVKHLGGNKIDYKISYSQ